MEKADKIQISEASEKDQIILMKDRIIAELTEQIALLKRMIYGKRSERFISSSPNPEQGSLFEVPPVPVIVQAEKEQITYERTKNKTNHKGRSLLEQCGHLGVEEEVIDIEHTEQAIKIGELISEKLAYIPGKLYIKRTVRPKYKEPQSENIITAPLPPTALPKCEADDSLISQIIVSKFVDHLPEYRQIEMFNRLGLKIPSSTMNDWTHRTASLLKPVADKILEDILKGRYVQMDESTIRVMSGKKNSTHLGYMWATGSPGLKMVHFGYYTGRGREAPAKILKNYIGSLQTDGYETYETLARSNDGIVHYGCWAHARRYFEQALNDNKEKAQPILQLIQKLYAIEQRCRDEDFTHEQRREERKQSTDILEQIKQQLDHYALTVTPRSLIGKATAYSLKRWAQLTGYTQQGEIEIDNNLIENAIRPLALGRKNYLFAGSHAAAENIGTFYTIFGTCKKLGINPTAYLNYFLQQVPTTNINQIHLITPMAYKNSTEA